MTFFDFEDIKSRVSLSKAAALLGLKMVRSGAQLRGPCPVCKGGGDRALVITEGKGYFCFSAKAGGDQIALVAHIRDLAVKDAAAWLSGSTQEAPTVPVTVPPAHGKVLEPLGYLEFDHAAVVAIGFDVEVAKRLGIGFAGRGMMRGTVAVPIRDEHGTLIAYIGIEGARLAPDLMSNVVAFGKKSA